MPKCVKIKQNTKNKFTFLIYTIFFYIYMLMGCWAIFQIHTVCLCEHNKFVCHIVEVALFRLAHQIDSFYSNVFTLNVITHSRLFFNPKYIRNFCYLIVDVTQQQQKSITNLQTLPFFSLTFTFIVFLFFRYQFYNYFMNCANESVKINLISFCFLFIIFNCCMISEPNEGLKVLRSVYINGLWLYKFQFFFYSGCF